MPAGHMAARRSLADHPPVGFKPEFGATLNLGPCPADARTCSQVNRASRLVLPRPQPPDKSLPSGASAALFKLSGEGIRRFKPERP
jgi:hypothetical protein